jgi:hypothetical protein
MALIYFSGLLAGIPVHILVSSDAGTYTQLVTILCAAVWLLCRFFVLPNGKVCGAGERANHDL